jgi:hypothetical protein
MDLEARLHVAEQDLVIEKGKAALAAPKSNQNEVFDLKEQIRHKDLFIGQLRKDNFRWRAFSEQHSSRAKELEEWKRRMKMIIDGDPEKP